MDDFWFGFDGGFEYQEEWDGEDTNDPCCDEGDYPGWADHEEAY